jgi:hypothetical protein
VLKELALKDSKCVAFNTMGWFKNEITSLSSCEVWGQNEGIYIKKEYYESLIKNNTIAKG